MPHPLSGPTAARNHHAKRVLHERVPAQLTELFKPGGFYSIAKTSVVEALRALPAFAALTQMPPDKIATAKNAMLDFLARTERGDSSAMDAVGLRVVSLATTTPAAYAKAARQALTAYLPKEDVDSSRALQGYLKDPSYLHQLVTDSAGKPQLTSGFFHDLGETKAIQLDYHSLVEGNPPDMIAGKIAFDRFLDDAKKAHGAADVVLVEVTPQMAARYQELDSRFTILAAPGKNGAGDAYSLLALPLHDDARRAMRDDPKALLNRYVDSWFDKNLGADWKTTQPAAVAAYDEMKTSKSPVWSQPVLPE